MFLIRSTQNKFASRDGGKRKKRSFTNLTSNLAGFFKLLFKFLISPNFYAIKADLAASTKTKKSNGWDWFTREIIRNAQRRVFSMLTTPDLSLKVWANWTMDFTFNSHHFKLGPICVAYSVARGTADISHHSQTQWVYPDSQLNVVWLLIKRSLIQPRLWKGI